MANPEHIAKLKEGVEVWNQWRENNADLKPNLRGADLSDTSLNRANLKYANLIRTRLTRANLSGANLKYANVSDANLIQANLSDVNLRYANLDRANLLDAKLTKANLEDVDLESTNLKGVCFVGTNLTGVNLSNRNLSNQDLSKANLTNAILQGVEALGTNFSGAILTGACIEDWNINSQTNLESIQCDYIYLERSYSEEIQKFIFTNRLPHDLNQIFAPCEFTNRYQKILETVELYFDADVNWQAFLVSFNKLQIECRSEELSINSFENKGNGAFIIRVNIPENSDKSEIEKYLNKKYQLEAKLSSLNDKLRSQIKDHNDLYEITKLLASRQTDITLQANELTIQQ